MKTLRKLYKKNYIFGKSIKSQHDANSSLVAWQMSTSHNFLNFLGSLINSVPAKQQLNGFLSGKQLNFSQGNKNLIRSKICNTSKGQQNQFFSAWFDLWCAITFVLLQDSFYGQTMTTLETTSTQGRNCMLKNTMIDQCTNYVSKDLS